MSGKLLTCIHVCIYVYIYIYIQREREIYICIYLFVHVFMLAYTRSPLEDSRLFGPSPWKVLATTYEKTISEQPSPWRKSSKRESCYGDRVYVYACLLLSFHCRSCVLYYNNSYYYSNSNSSSNSNSNSYRYHIEPFWIFPYRDNQ